MRKNLFLSVLVFAISLIFLSCASNKNLVLTEGNLEFLKNEYKLKLKYDYSNLKIPCCKDESSFIDSVRISINSQDSGMGDVWKKSWFHDREEKMQPAFETAAIKYLLKAKMQIDTSYADAKYTMVIKTVEIEPGDVVGNGKQTPTVLIDVIFVETANPNRVLAKMELDRVEGSLYMTSHTESYGGRYHYFTSAKMRSIGTRLITCYEQAGILIGRALASYLGG